MRAGMVAVLAALLVSGCGAGSVLEPAPPAARPPVRVNVGPGDEYGIYMQYLRLPDGRLVPCVIAGSGANGRIDAISCDWTATRS
jgi:hypothetical protein